MMARLNLEIDHVGILGPSLAELVRELNMLGFSIVGPAELTAIDSSGDQVRLGQSSAHIMFQDDYIELTCVESPYPGHHLEHFLHPPWGIRLLLLASGDIEREHRRCERSRLSPAEVQEASRRIDYDHGAEARFKWFGFPDTDWREALVAYVQHLTRDTVFDPSVARHPNGACCLTRLYYRGSDLPDRYSQLAGEGRHTVELVEPGDEQAVLGFSQDRTTPFAGVGVGVTDIIGTAAVLSSSGIDARPVGTRLSTQLRSGVCVVFEECPARG